MKITWVEKNDLMAVATRAMQPVEVLLDIGCGIVPQSYVKPKVHICCEPYAEYVGHLQKKFAAMDARDRSSVVLNMGWAEAARYFPEKSVDTVILVDVIEHLEKDDGRALLALTERIARRQVIFFTPLGFMPQHHADGKDAWGLGGADWQEHKSGWMPEDFVGEEWEFFAAREFHTIDSHGAPVDKPYGAFWAIKTYQAPERSALMDREIAVQVREADSLRRQAELQEREVEINALIFARVERKFRRMLRSIFLK